MKGVVENDDADLKDRLRALREEPSDDFAFRASLHRRLVQAGPPGGTTAWARGRDALRTWGQWVWPASGVLAGILTFLVLSTVQGRAVRSSLMEPGTSVPVSKVAVIKLDFDAEVAVEQVDFQISLPEGLSFWADGESLPQRSFEWRQGLEAGKNQIPVAVRGQKPGRYKVTAIARVGDERIEHEVMLEVTEG